MGFTGENQDDLMNQNLDERGELTTGTGTCADMERATAREDNETHPPPPPESARPQGENNYGLPLFDNGGDDSTISNYDDDGNAVIEIEDDSSRIDAEASTHSTVYTVNTANTTGENSNKSNTIGKRETKAVGRVRMVVFGVLLLVAATVSAGTYWYSHHVELDNLEIQFQDYGSNVLDSYESNAARRLLAIESLADAFTSHAMSLPQNQPSWPFVTLPDFERRATVTRDLAAVFSVTVLPIVSTEERAAWEKYSIENQGWLTEGLAIQERQATAEAAGNTTRPSRTTGGVIQDADEMESVALLENIKETDGLEIPHDLYRFAGTGSEPETGEGPYLPWWQFAPAFPYSGLVNYNARSHPGRVKEIDAVLQNEIVLLSRSLDISNTSNPDVLGKKAALNLFLNRWKDGSKGYEEGPMCDLYVPIFDSFRFDGSNNTKRKMVSIMTAYVYWQIYFTNILPENSPPIDVVLENTCDQTFTYQIRGRSASYIGPGDLHTDLKYDDLALHVATEYGSILHGQQADNLLPGQCLYRIHVYPTKDFEEEFLTRKPLYFALALVATFLATSAVFLVYDSVVERRQRLVLTTAIQSSTVVNTLFPAEVRSRLYAEGGGAKAATANATSTALSAFHRGDVEKSQNEKNGHDAAAIADLYPNCTVMFGDLAGFTAWSDGRHPQDVFQLLETIYAQFDRAAKRRAVFKVETIGDCYLCVTGLPSPQEDHAIIMARFAAECQLKLDEIIHRSEVVAKLGEATTKLRLRVGLHSGPVTAGVLRGSKARFQLFGDTVNTASRMESNGQPGKIQASQATADLLLAANRKHWISARPNLVEAKGKGAMQTYWIEPRSNTTNSEISRGS